VTRQGAACEHIASLEAIRHPRQLQCDECVKTGDEWVHLRTCQTCGATLCCDNSINRHATRHAQRSGHPVIVSAEPGEQWLYCYPDAAFAAY
jgi:hypothetical protein